MQRFFFFLFIFVVGAEVHAFGPQDNNLQIASEAPSTESLTKEQAQQEAKKLTAVSYTHLTLPTTPYV